MQLFRTLCVVAVLSALSYGAYLTLTGSPPVEPALDRANYDSPPPVELPIGQADATKTAAGPAEATPPKTPPSPGMAKLGAPSITAVRTNSDSPPIAPSPYPSTNTPPGPFDNDNATKLAFPEKSIATTADIVKVTELPGRSLSDVVPPSPSSASAIEPTASTSPISNTPPVATPIPSTSNDPLVAVQPLLDRRDYALALEQLSQAFDDPRLPPEVDRRVMEMLDQLAGTVIYSREHLLEPPHTVQPGEQLEQIAARYQMSPALLAKINGIVDARSLPPGAQLKVIRNPFDAVVDKSRRRISLFSGRLYAGSFPVGFGQDAAATDGQYTVTGVLPPGPSGPNRYVDLGNGMAIHSSQESLASDQARGCIRLSPEDDAEVTDILTAGSRVMIRP